MSKSSKKSHSVTNYYTPAKAQRPSSNTKSDQGAKGNKGSKASKKK